VNAVDDRERKVSELREMFDRVCRKLEPKAYEREQLLWYNLSGDEKFNISYPDTEGLTEIHHALRIPKPEGYESEDKIDIVAYVDEEVANLALIASGNLPSHKSYYRNDVRITDMLERTVIVAFNALLFS
jgi:hypothetical protein